MNIFGLARNLLEMYEQSEMAALDESSMSNAKYQRKVKSLQEDVLKIEAQIQALEDAHHAERGPDYHQ